MIYQYQVEGGELYDIETGWAKDTAAELAAEDYHSNHDGWEAAWPLDITIFDDGDPESGVTYTVYREAEPIFSAYKKEKE